MLLTILECSLILRAVGKLLFSGTVLHVVFPEALVFLPVGMRVDTEAGRAILDELARVQVAILVMEVALTLSKTKAPITLIPRAIRPRLHSFSMLYKNFFLGFCVIDYLNLTSVDGTLADLQVCLMNDFGFIDGLNLGSFHLGSVRDAVEFFG